MRICFTLFLSCFLYNSSFSQSWSYGPEIGMNLIKIDQSHTGGNYSPSWHVGGFTKLSLNDFFSIQTGIYFSQKKQSYSSADTALSTIFSVIGISDDFDQFDLNTYTNTTGRTTQNYIEIPFLAKISYKGVNLFSGIYTGFMFNSTNKEIQSKNTPVLSLINPEILGPLSTLLPASSEITENVIQNPSNLKPFDFGAKFGASYLFDRLELNIAYSLGLLDYRNDSSGLISQKHQYFQMSISYNFGANLSNTNFWQSKKLK
ncbi:MAG: porin family protein [Crocinitomicaceae bacterium]